MPRDPAVTRERLLDAGRELFALHGALTTPLKQVVEAAGQRNSSALHYHFGGRDGLLFAIIAAHNDGIEAERRAVLDALGDQASLRQVVDAFIGPQVRLLSDAKGRQFLSIVSQLIDLFDRWDAEGDAVPAQALRALRMIEARLPEGLEPGVRRERITLLLALVSEALGARARQIDRGHTPTLDDQQFAANLTDMAVGALSAVPGPAPAQRLRRAPAGSR